MPAVEFNSTVKLKMNESTTSKISRQNKLLVNNTFRSQHPSPTSTQLLSSKVNESKHF